MSGVAGTHGPYRGCYRIFQSDTARRIRFIKRAQELGFSLVEIKDLLFLRTDGNTTQAEFEREPRQSSLMLR
jgi:DNA-binding transcriptional MerR regulator